MQLFVRIKLYKMILNILSLLRAVAVDMFPHTDKYELIVLFERFDESRWRNIMEGEILLLLFY